MYNIHRQTMIGIGAILAALFLVIVAVPTWVSSPSNVPNVILSPLFWPYTLAGLTGLIGIGLVLTGLASADRPRDEDATPRSAGGWARLLLMAIIMVGYMYALPRLGMVWASMIAFIATAFLMHTRHPKVALICAVAVPLVLYIFFAHVAEVAIPQGLFVRLP